MTAKPWKNLPLVGFFGGFLTWIRDASLSLIENETEISFFNGRDYEAFKLDPQVRKDISD